MLAAFCVVWSRATWVNRAKSADGVFMFWVKVCGRIRTPPFGGRLCRFSVGLAVETQARMDGIEEDEYDEG